jgi:single-stranded-DNA-specific exonuclease
LPEPEKVGLLVSELGISPFLAGLLVNRGFSRPESAEAFLNPRLDMLHDPMLMKGMAETLGRIASALEHGEKILIYGDYDVDGITSTVVLRRALEMLGGEVDYHIPLRLEDGYGFKSEVLESAAASGIKLVISVDCGIREVEACRFARELGIDVIVTDHHLPGDELPEVTSILNPRQSDCEYPDKNLAAVGVVFKLVQALFESRDRKSVVPHFLKVVAIGTVADMVPLLGENRVIVRHGLSSLSESHNLGLKVLLDGAGVGKVVDNFDIGFKVAPRINAFTRMGGGGEIVDLFSVDDRSAAVSIVDEMNRRNMERRQEEARILTEIGEMLEERPELADPGFVVLAGEGWHRGVIGNVASRLVERFHKPALIISLGEERNQGSGRSIPGFHILEALEHCESYLERFGGHAQAAGLTLKQDYTDEKGFCQFKECLQSYAAVRLVAADMEPVLQIDGFLEIGDVNFQRCADLDRLAPFGIGNPFPVFATRSLPISAGPWVLKGKHLKFRSNGGGTPLDVIWWQNGERAANLGRGDTLDVAYTLSRDTYQGREKLLLTLQDLQQS